MNIRTTLIAVVALAIGVIIGMFAGIPGTISNRHYTARAALKEENRKLRQLNQVLEQQANDLVAAVSQDPGPLKEAVEEHFRTMLTSLADGQVKSIDRLDPRKLDFKLDSGKWISVAQLLAMTSHFQDSDEVLVCDVSTKVAGPGGTFPDHSRHVWILTVDDDVYQVREPIPIDRLRFRDTKKPLVEEPSSDDDSTQ